MKIMTSIFLGIEFLLYFLFMGIDVNGIGSNSMSIQLKFLSILICFLYTILLCLVRQVRSVILSLSFLCLILSDYFLLIKDSYETGVSTFLLVQICYFISISLDEGRNVKKIVIHFWGILGITLVCIVVLLRFGIPIDRMLVISVAYFLAFIQNVLLSIIRSRRTTKLCDQLFSIGLILYFICDLNVGIFNLKMYVNLGTPFFDQIYQFATIAMWLFYLPGIVLITLSNNKTYSNHKC